MGVHILEDKQWGYKCLYCSTSMWAFGCIFYEDDDVEDFLEWLDIDARKLSDKDFNNKVWEWRNTKERG